MKDKNGTEIKTGMIVEITGAYFKNDNGLYFVIASPGDRSWNGKAHCLCRISKAGKISTAKYRICYWPIMICSGSRARRYEGHLWNERCAEIEVKQIANMEEVIAYFQDQASTARKEFDRLTQRFDQEAARHNLELAEHFEKIVAEIRGRMEAAAPIKESDRIRAEIAELDAEYDRLCEEMVYKNPTHSKETHDALWKKFWDEHGFPMTERKRLLEWDLDGALNQELQVGDGVTYHLWSDAHAYTIIARTAKTLTIQRDKATYAPGYKPEYVPGGFSVICTNDADQEWVYERDPEGETRMCHWSRKLKRWQSDGCRISRGRHENYDHNF